MSEVLDIIRSSKQIGSATCAHCGDRFTPKSGEHQRQSDRGFPVYCSDLCKGRASAKRARSRSPVRECVQCGAEFRSEVKKQRFCSQKCAGYGRKKHQKPFEGK